MTARSTVSLPVADRQRAARFYLHGFGLELVGDPHETLLGLALPSARDVDATLDRVVRAGGDILVSAEDQDWGYSAVCTDPDGHAWQLTAPPTSAS